MRVAEWKRTVRPLLPADARWEFRRSLAYRLPMEWVVLGVLAQGSSFDKGVYIWRVSTPLFDPLDVLSLSWSDRVGGGAAKFYADGPPGELTAAIEEAFRLPATEDEALDDMIQQHAVDSPNPNEHEVAAYARILRGDLRNAKVSLDKALSLRSVPPVAEEQTWVTDIYDRVALVATLLRAEGRDAVVAQLGRWRDHTCGALGLRRS